MYIAIDIGGSTIRVAGAENLENPDFSKTLIQSAPSDSFIDDFNFIVKSTLALGENSIASIGIGVTGDIDGKKSMVTRSAVNPHWDRQPFTEPLSKRLRCPIFLDNDAVAGALGEAYFGDTLSDFGYVVWGTGIGGVLVHRIPVARTVDIDNINQDWDKYFSEWHYACGAEAILKRYGHPGEKLSLTERRELFTTFHDYLRQFARVTRVSTIVFGGSTAASFAKEFSAVSDDEVRLKIAKHGNQAGIYGAFAVTRQALLKEA